MKDYKKILEGVVDIIKATEKSDIGFANICTYIGENFPELAESEDERIRETNRIITQEELNKMGEELSNYAESQINQQFSKISNDMNYEQKYKEANDKVAARFGTNVAKEIFTDLYESEDERIRKCITLLVNGLTNEHFVRCGASLDEIEVWLEKQEGCEYIKKDWLEHIKQSWYKEGFIDGKYTPKELTINDATTLNELIDYLENGTAKLQHDLTLYANWLKNLKQRMGGKL